MRTLCLCTLFGMILLVLVPLGCSRPADPRDVVVEAPAQPVAVPLTATTPPPPPVGATLEAGPSAGQALMLPVSTTEPSAQERYDAALLEALNDIAEQKYAEALVSLGAAKAAQNTERVQQEIDKVKGLISQRMAAVQITQDIKTVLDDGKAEEAANLATASLQQYGSGDHADQLALLKRQADALTLAENPDARARQERFRKEGEAALAARNLRAAAVAFEQALQGGEDPALRRQYDDLQATLARYDALRRRAAELRRDPLNLEEALAALQEAAQAWDTTEVHEEIELYTLALQKRRSTLSVADFEVRGDVGIPYAGRTIAEQLLPACKARYDLVERAQLSRVLDELRLDANDLAGNSDGRREAGRLARVQYLILGSVTPLCGITVNARLVEVRSGLIVQTAQIVARSPEEMLRLLPQLANLLMLTDEQKLAYEQQVAQRSPIVVQPVVIAPLPPPPPLLAVEQPPPPIVVYNPRPPAVGGLVVADFQQLPPVGAPIAVQFVAEREEPVKRKLLQITVALGDNLFRRGRFQEAHRHFELALTLAPHEVDVRTRIERCRPRLPPPLPVVVAQPVVVAVARPRIAVLNFVVNADAAHAPPGFGDWAADQLASYFAPTYEVVDRGELYWYMGRLGCTVRDVALDPATRRWLGRALNVRYFAFGIAQQTASLDVSTHLIDVESGAKQGVGSIHVQDQQELKLRMAELSQQTQTSPAERERLQREARENEQRLNQVRQFLAKGQFDQAIQVSREALKKNPNDVGMQALLARAEQQAKAAALARQQAEQQRQAQAAVAQRKQQELARAAEVAKQKAAQEAAARTEAAKRAQEQQRQAAHDRLMVQGSAALKQHQVQQAIQYFQSAVALRPTDDGVHALAEARAQAEKEAKAQAAQEQARRAAEQQKQKDAEIARARAQVEAQRKQQDAAAQAQRKAQETHDQAAAAKFLAEGKQLLAQGKFDAALSPLQAAQRLQKSPEAEALLAQASEKAAAAKQDVKARADQAKALAAQKAQRDQAEAQAARNRDLYTRALQEAQKALAEKRFDVATTKYQEAAKLFHTDAVLNGLKQVKEAQDKERAVAEAARQKQQQQQQQAAAVQQLLNSGRTALAAGQLDNAARALAEAKKLAPENVEVQKSLIQVEQAQQQRTLQAQKKVEEQKRLEAEAKQKAAAQAPKPTVPAAGAPKTSPPTGTAPAPKQTPPAKVQPVTPAPQPKPQPVAPTTPPKAAPTAPAPPAKTQPTAPPAVPPRTLPTAPPAAPPKTQPAAPPAAKPQPIPPQVAAEYAKQMQLAATLEKQQKYDDVVKVYEATLKLVPGDAKATLGLHLAAGHKALAGRKFPEAAKQFEEVLRLSPNHPEATKALQQARQGRP